MANPSPPKVVILSSSQCIDTTLSVLHELRDSTNRALQQKFSGRGLYLHPPASLRTYTSHEVVADFSQQSGLICQQQRHQVVDGAEVVPNPRDDLVDTSGCRTATALTAIVSVRCFNLKGRQQLTRRMYSLRSSTIGKRDKSLSAIFRGVTGGDK
jgi:hypothetical protein